MVQRNKVLLLEAVLIEIKNRNIKIMIEMTWREVQLLLVEADKEDFYIDLWQEKGNMWNIKVPKNEIILNSQNLPLEDFSG